MKNLFFILFLLLPVKVISQNSTDIDTLQVYILVDTMPSLVDGGDFATEIRQFILKEMQYPDTLTCGLISTIYFEFIISYEGKVIHPNVFFRSNYPECENDYEVLRKTVLDLLNRLPEFKPGMQNGKYVNVKFLFPMHIHLQ